MRNKMLLVVGLLCLSAVAFGDGVAQGDQGLAEITNRVTKNEEEIKKINKKVPLITTNESRLDNLESKQTALEQKITNKINEYDTDIGGLKIGSAALRKEVETIDGKTDANATKIDKNINDIKVNADMIKQNTDTIQQNTADIAQNTTSIEQNALDIVDLDEKVDDNFNVLEDKIVKNKKNIAKNKKAVVKNKKNIAKNKKAVAKNKKNIAKNEIDIAINRDEIAKNTEAIEDLDTYVDALSDTVIDNFDELKDEIVQNAKDIKDLDERVDDNFDVLGDEIALNAQDIARNTQYIKDLRKDHNIGMAQMAAMASVDFGNVKPRTVKVGAAVGYHSSETAVAVGVAIAPTDALMINAKWSTPTNSIKKSTLGLGATYEFSF